MPPTLRSSTASRLAGNALCAAAATAVVAAAPWPGRQTDRPTDRAEAGDPADAHEECGTRALMRGTANWTCVRVDAEQSFAPKHVATLPEPGIETANKAAVCLVGQVSGRPRVHKTT